MEQKKQIIEFAVTSFLPGALLFTLSLVFVIPLILSRGDFSVFEGISWRVFFVEQILLIGGFALVLSILIKRGIAPTRKRGVLAGIISIFLLGLASVFTQGANLLMIVMMSLLAGMISALTMLPFNKRRLV